MVRICARARRADRPVRRGHVARGPRRRPARRRSSTRPQMDGDPAPVGRGHGRDRPGRRDPTAARRPSCAPRACSSRSTPARTRRSAGWSPPARRGRPPSATGTMRENVISLTVVTADGASCAPRSRARKSSAGYDLTRLFIGSEGTLGLITEATLRDAPRRPRRWAPRSAPSRGGGRRRLRRRGAPPGIPVARIELLDALQIEAVNRHAGLGPRGGADPLPRVPRRPERGLRSRRRRSRRSHPSMAASQFAWADRRVRAPAAVARPPPRLRRRAGDPGRAATA